MIKFPRCILLTAISMILLSCSPNSDQNKPKREVILGRFEFTDGWARPGIQGGSSAAYLAITNGTASTDTLTGASSEGARGVELHESFEDEAGVVSMRPMGRPIILSGESLHLQPGGAHLMLKGLKRELAVGDSVRIALHFSHLGAKSVTLPVKINP